MQYQYHNLKELLSHFNSRSRNFTEKSVFDLFKLILNYKKLLKKKLNHHVKYTTFLHYLLGKLSKLKSGEIWETVQIGEGGQISKKSKVLRGKS